MNEASYKEDLNAFTQQHGCQLESHQNEFTLVIKAGGVIDICTALRDHEKFLFEQLVDIAGVDYLEYGRTEWKTKQATDTGFSRGVSHNTFGRFTFDDNPIDASMEEPRFAVVYHLLSVSKNQRLRVKAICEDNNFPRVPSVCSIWNCANWYEREAFDLYGIMFEGHPDLRRLLTDYGFIGHPLRKDFPLVGHVEVRFDPIQQRVIQEPVSIEPRVLVPKVIRDDNRYTSDNEES